MGRKIQRHAGWLAAALIVAATAVPAYALDLGDRSKGLGVSVDVGSKAGGLGVGVGATVGRSNGIMGGIAKQFSNDELRQLSRYIGSLDGDMQTVVQPHFKFGQK